ncbi:MAG: hypothetical protein GKR87_02280 [Kiritimatiellae bacterium]|nr:hypothetical protein [Kiritimatiellia bacterium]
MKQCSLRVKIIIILFIPLLGMSFSASQVVLEKHRIAKDMKKLVAIENLSIKISSLIHETQKERGYTASFIGNKGKSFSKELSSQHLHTDEKINELKQCIDHQPLSSYGDQFNASLSNGMYALDQLQETRNRITRLKIKATEALGYYTQMHSAFLDAILLCGRRKH